MKQGTINTFSSPIQLLTPERILVFFVPDVRSNSRTIFFSIKVRVDQKCLSYKSHKWQTSCNTIPSKQFQTYKWKLEDKHFAIT